MVFPVGTFIRRDDIRILFWQTVIRPQTLLQGDVGAVVGVGHGLAVLHSHHQDDAHSHQGKPGQDGDQDDEDGGDHQVGLSAGVGHDMLRLCLLQSECVEGGWLTDPLHVGGGDGNDVSVAGEEPGEEEGWWVLGQVEQLLACPKGQYLIETRPEGPIVASLLKSFSLKVVGQINFLFLIRGQ